MTALPHKPLATRNNLLTLGALVVLVVLLVVFENSFDSFTMQIFKLCAINVILALSLNLINGFTGLFSLGHAGFMAIGAYTCAILTMSPMQKEANYVLAPIAPWLANVQIPFVPALLLAGLYALFGDVVMPTLNQRIKDMFNYAGALGG